MPRQLHGPCVVPLKSTIGSRCATIHRARKIMSDALLSTRRLYLWLTGSFLAGIACGVNDQLVFCLVIVALLGIFLGYVCGRHLTHKTWIVICLMPLIAFAYARWRVNGTALDPLEIYAGRSAILQGTLSEKLSTNSAGHQNYLLC